jgi:hypothetical protein
MPVIKNQTHDEKKGKVPIKEQVDKHVKRKTMSKAKETQKML